MLAPHEGRPARDVPYDVTDSLVGKPGGDSTARPGVRLLVRVLVIVIVTLGLGINYVLWRWTSSVSWSVWWIALPLVLAETYSLIDSFLFGITMWRIKERGEPQPPDPNATVDVFVTTYNEDVDLVMTTARAARDITTRTAPGSSTTGPATRCAAPPSRTASATSRALPSGRTCPATPRRAT